MSTPLPAELGEQRSGAPRSRLEPSLLRHLPQTFPGAELWVTFDDGPHPQHTPAVLGILRSVQARATFFLCGEFARAEPELCRALLREGHAVGNHGWSHARLTDLPDDAVARELDTTRRLLNGITGTDVDLYRPPYGSSDARVRRIATGIGLREVLWTWEIDDWLTSDPCVLTRKLKRGLQPGSVLLLHDGCADELRPRGERPVLGTACRRSLLLALPSALRDARRRLVAR